MAGLQSISSLGARVVGYARVSTQEQDTSLQLEALNRIGCTCVYEEKASGAKLQRPVLWQCLDSLRLAISSFSTSWIGLRGPFQTFCKSSTV